MDPSVGRCALVYTYGLKSIWIKQLGTQLLCARAVTRLTTNTDYRYIHYYSSFVGKARIVGYKVRSNG